MTTQTVSNAIVSQLLSLREKKGSLALEDVKSILENAAQLLAGGSSALDAFLRDEILKIANHIEATRNEINALIPAPSTAQAVGASEQLSAVLSATEQAAHRIMDAADEIQSIVAGANVDDATRERITEVTGRIYEACNFQDLTGQRITKVMQALEFTESRIRRLMSLYGADGTPTPRALEHVARRAGEGNLMNGPQLPSEAPSQADIDRLFQNLK